MANNGGARFGLFACSDFLIGIHREEDEQIETDAIRRMEKAIGEVTTTI